MVSIKNDFIRNFENVRIIIGGIQMIATKFYIIIPNTGKNIKYFLKINDFNT